MNNQVNQITKSNKKAVGSFKSNKKAVGSLRLGIFSLIGSFFAFYFRIPGVSTIILFIMFFIALVGLILGIGGLRSIKKREAIAGIILCLIVLILTLNISGFLGKG